MSIVAGENGIARDAGETPTLPRAAGLLLHPTSLPGPHGIGDLGAEAIRFVDVLADMGFRYWQMLPLGPTGYGDSPYQCFSAFAGNPLLIAVAGAGGSFPEHTIDFSAVIAHKRALLDRATAAFIPDARFARFVETEAAWLEDYALFMALKEAHGGAAWTAWETGAMQRDEDALVKWRTTLAPSMARHRIEQYVFFTQLRALRTACAKRGIQLIGDLPIYVAHDSADVWANRELFQLHDDGSLIVQAGVPPDYFSRTGQLWGNPLYDWPALRASGFAWWIERVRATLRQFDLVRIDHFRGFESYWEVAGDASTAEHGRWAEGPGDALFHALREALGPLPIIAENLGDITPAVEALRARWGWPGMAILQFAFDPQAKHSPFLPHNFERELVVYTGTHDNDTTVGWFSVAGDEASSSSASTPNASTSSASTSSASTSNASTSNASTSSASTSSASTASSSTSSASTASASTSNASTPHTALPPAERARALAYLDTDGSEMHWDMIRAAMSSVAQTAIVPMQDLLGLGSAARMNFPGREVGNWGFRFQWEQLTPEIRKRMRDMARLYERA